MGASTTTGSDVLLRSSTKAATTVMEAAAEAGKDSYAGRRIASIV